ncbi:hypothetical protein SAMN06298216_0838 [Spirosomataceae bacterium TFI 002]|nr:hypothetical protein SAMN06298216_0838 [Spirosomataceae bacterium TFI 002]
MKTLIDHGLIKSLKTKSYLRLHNLKNTSDLKLIIPTCYTQDKEKEFNLHQKSYLVNYPIDQVWDAYLNIPPSKAWSGKKIQFSFSFDFDKDQISYTKDKYEGLRVGQLIFLEIKLAFGLVKLAVTHQVNEISEAKKSMKFCYVEGGKASGSQMLSLVKKGENQTEVVHNTYYKSDSKFRDKRLYPTIHESIINEFHRNVFNFLRES